MTDEKTEFHFGALLADCIQGLPSKRLIDDEAVTFSSHGAELSLPVRDFMKFAVIGADAVAGSDVEGVIGESLDFPIDRAVRVLDLMTVYEVSETRGKLPIGTTPAVTMQAESVTAGADADPGISDVTYHTDSVVECKSSYSMELAIQAGDNPNIGMAIEESHRQAIREELLAQAISGDGVGNNLAGILGTVGIGMAEYTQANIARANDFISGEEAVEDSDADPSRMAWLVGTTLDSSLRSRVNDPGSDRRSIERKVMTLSGYPALRSYSAMPVDQALLCDWGSIALIVQGDLHLTIDRLTRPGEIRLTSRLTVADPQVTRPQRIYKIVPAWNGHDRTQAMSRTGLP